MHFCTTPPCLEAAADLLGKQNSSYKACDDFWNYACGGWLSRNPLPSTRSSWSTLESLQVWIKTKYLLIRNFKFCLPALFYLDINIVHKSSCSLYIRAPDPLIDKLYQIQSIKGGLELKKQGHTNFNECCDLTKKLYISHCSNN